MYGYGSRDIPNLKSKFAVNFALLTIVQLNALSRLRFSRANSLHFTAEMRDNYLHVCYNNIKKN